MYNGRKEKIVATIEARMTSSRLPGKVLLPIAGIPALEMMIERLKRSKYLDAICIATTTNVADDSINELAEKLSVGCFRGSESDVLKRVLSAARYMNANVIVEMTGDCPFADPTLVDRGVKEFFSREVDYASNVIRPTFANGFDVQVFPTNILEEVDELTNDPIDRTHVSYYIYTHPEKYRIYNWEAGPDEFGPELRMTLDEQVDYTALCAVADALIHSNPYFTAVDVTKFLRSHPEVVSINNSVNQKEAHEL